MMLNECFESLIIMITFPFRIVEAAAMDLAYDSLLLVETHLILLYHWSFSFVGGWIDNV